VENVTAKLRAKIKYQLTNIMQVLIALNALLAADED
jgi:hypothetical protein